MPRALEPGTNGLELESLDGAGELSEGCIEDVRRALEGEGGIINKHLARISSVGNGAVVVEVLDPALCLVEAPPSYVLGHVHPSGEDITRLDRILSIPSHSSLHIPVHQLLEAPHPN